MCTERIFPLVILSSIVVRKGIQKIVDAYEWFKEEPEPFFFLLLDSWG